MESENRIGIWTAISVLAALCLGTLLLVWYHFNTTQPKQPSAHQELIQNNTDYQKAAELVNQGDYKQAAEFYTNALSTSQDPFERTLIQYELGIITNRLGDHLQAIQMLKQVVDATSTTDEIRAFAVQYLAGMTTDYGNSPEHVAIMKEIFKDPPYSSLLDTKDEYVTTRHLYEYSVSFYPLAVSELNIADWYLKAIRLGNISTTTSPGNTYVSLVLGDVSKADYDIARMKYSNLPGMEFNIPLALLRKAVVASELFHLGTGTFASAKQSYLDAIESYTTYHNLPGTDGYARLFAAGFLSHTKDPSMAGMDMGTSTENDVHAVISPLYTSPEIYAQSDVVNYLKSLSSVITTLTPKTTRENDKLRALQIAKVDSGFKTFLISLGWNKSEFNKQVI